MRFPKGPLLSIKEPVDHTGFLSMRLVVGKYFHEPYNLPDHLANHRSNQTNRNRYRYRDRVSDVVNLQHDYRPI
jgi:hypothetical protein